MITSEWGTPNMVKDGLNPELLLAGKYGHKLHIWDLDKRRHLQEIDLGAEQQMVLELRPAHDPKKTFGFVGVVVSLKDLSSSIWMWYREDGGKNGKWAVRKVIEIPAEPADPENLPPLLKGFKAVPPLVTDINLSLDDRFLYVSCWGTGEFIQYDVSDPANPKKTGSIHLGGIVRRAAHPKKPKQALNGGPQMVEISRDGKRVYFTNSLYSPWDEQFYPDGVKSWMVKIDANPKGGMKLDEKFFVEFDGVARAPAPAGRRRRFVGLLLLLGHEMTHAGLTSTALWLMLLLGAYHGLNPGMGWLFAVALGMQEQKGSAVARSLVPIALGHALAIGSVVLVAAFLGMTLPLAAIRYSVAAILVGLGIYCLVRHWHPRWVRMQVGFRDLTVWSFLMASAHGAGLMVVPVLLGSNTVEAQGQMAGHDHLSATGRQSRWPGCWPPASIPLAIWQSPGWSLGWSIESSASPFSARRGSTSTWSGPARSWPRVLSPCLYKTVVPSLRGEIVGNRERFPICSNRLSQSPRSIDQVLNRLHQSSTPAAHGESSSL